MLLAASVFSRPSACVTKLWRGAGLQGCGVDTVNGDPGTEFEITFAVFDRSQPPATASLRQSIIVTSPCSSTQVYCPGKAPACGEGPCALRADPAPPAVPPDIIVDMSAASPLVATLSNVSGSETVAQGLHVDAVCGHELPVDIAICGVAPAQGLPGRSSSNDEACLLSVRRGPQVAALPSIVTATNTPVCSDSSEAGVCYLCSLQVVSSGACIASRQQYELQAVDDQGTSGAPLRLSITVADRCSVMQLQMTGEVAAVSQEALQESVEGSEGSLGSSPIAVAVHALLMQHVRSSAACSSMAMQGPVIHVELKQPVQLVGSVVPNGNGVVAAVYMASTVAMGVRNSSSSSFADCQECADSLELLQFPSASFPVNFSGGDPSEAWLGRLVVNTTSPEPHECPVTPSAAAEITLWTGLWDVQAAIDQLAQQVRLSLPPLGSDKAQPVFSVRFVCVFKGATEQSHIRTYNFNHGTQWPGGLLWPHVQLVVAGLVLRLGYSHQPRHVRPLSF